MFGNRSTSTPKVSYDRSRSVTLDDLSIRKYASTVRRIFFPVWPEHGQWNFVLEKGQPWAWACDFEKQTIFVSRHRYPEKDLLRTALIVQMAHARSGIGSPAAWLTELERAQSVADTIGREQIVRYLSEIMREAGMNTLDIRCVEGSERLETHITNMGMSAEGGETVSVDGESTFQDSLQLGYVERQLDQASLALKRLGLKKASVS